MSLKKWVVWIVLLAGGLGALLLAVIFIFPLNAERLSNQNQVLPHEPFSVSDDAQSLHNTLRIADWHVDTLMWLRSIEDRSELGQVDLPRLRDGNVAIQVFTSVTRVPAVGIQVENNPGKGDQISTLAFVDKWPKSARTSLFARAQYHAEKLRDVAERNPDELVVIKNRDDLIRLLDERSSGSRKIGGLLGTEGLHPLEGDLKNVQALFGEGYRVTGLFHFFDNELGGSLHGLSQQGLSPFGKDVVQELNARHIIIDVAHASEAAVREILALSDRPVILSHTGMRGVCDSRRNIPDSLMSEIANDGGLIGIGYFEIGICKMTLESVVDHIEYAVKLLGIEHVSLGSDFDGSVATPFDVSELSAITQELVDRGFSEQDIRAIMGENTIRFLLENLPE